jgi:hypothetical protein
MIITEMPGYFDLMTVLSMGAVTYSDCDSSKTPEEKIINSDKLSLIATVFCGISIHINETYSNEGYKSSPTMFVFDDPDIDGGVYQYIVKDPDMTTLPKPGSETDGFVLYGSITAPDPFIEIYFKNRLVMNLEAIYPVADCKGYGKATINPHYAINPSLEADEEMKNAFNVVSAGMMNAIMTRNLSITKGYNDGYKQAMEDLGGIE